MLQGILNLIQSSYNLEASIKLKKLLGIESPSVDIQRGKKGDNTLAAFLSLFFSFLYLFPHDFFFLFIFGETSDAAAAAAVASVVSDPVRPQRPQPTRLPRPWDSAGKNTGVGCQFLFQN